VALENRAYELFAQEYAQHHNCRKAAIAAGRSPSTGSALLQRPEVQNRIDQLADQAFTKANITAFRVIKELARIAFADPRGLYDEFGNFIPVHELDDDTAAVVAGIKVSIEGGKRGRLKRGHEESGNEEDTPIIVTKDVKIVGKTEALVVLAKHFKLIGDEVDGANALANALADRLNAAKRRENQRAEAEDAVMRAPSSAQRAGSGMLSYGVPDEPSNPDDVTSPRLQRAKFDPESLHFDLPGAEVAQDRAPAQAQSRPSAPGATPATPPHPTGGIDMLADLDDDDDDFEPQRPPPLPMSMRTNSTPPAFAMRPSQQPQGDGDETFW
jgi:phage terminase small subunit